MSPQPITAFLTDFDAPPTPPAAGAPPTPAAQRTEAPATIPAPANDEGHARAFAAGKEEGVKLAEARHALERRRRETEEDRRAAARVAEAEARIGAVFAERLTEEVAALEARLSADLLACLAPFVADAAERVAVDAIVRDAARLTEAARWTVSGPRGMADAFLGRLDPALRGRVEVVHDEAIDLTVRAGDTCLATRMGALRDALASLR